MQPVGVIHTPYTTLEKMPIQPKGAQSVPGRIILDPMYQEGLLDLDGFSHIYLLYLFHRSKDYSLNVTPFMDNTEHGVFATRAPRRPNPIGLSIVRLLDVNGNQLEVEGVDMLDGTPLLDIKPYIDAFDRVESALSGWLNATGEQIADARSDQRFIE